MSEKQEAAILCCANFYEQKYYLNPDFERLPEAIKAELKIMCVLFTEDIGGILLLQFDENGDLQIRVEADEEDILFDDIGCGLKVKELQQSKYELFCSLELYYKVMTGKASPEEIYSEISGMQGGEE